MLVFSNTVTFLLVLLFVLPILGVSITSADSSDLGLLRIAGVQHPRQVAPSSQFSIVIDAEYAFHTNATVKSALFQGSLGKLGPQLWQSNQLNLSRGGDELWTVNITAPPTEQDWTLTAFAYYFQDGKWQYFADEVQGPGFLELNIRVAKLATLEIDLGTPNVTLKIDNSTVKTSNAGNILLQLPVGLTHEVSVPPLLPFENSTRLIFYGWRDNVNNTERAFLLDGDTKLVGSYRTQYLLRVNSIVSTYAQTGWYYAGDNVSLHVESSLPMSGPFEFLGIRYEFKDWSGDFESSSTSINVTIDKPKVINANFKANYTPLIIPAILAGGILGGILLAALRRKRTKPTPTEEESTEVVGSKLCDSCGEPIEEEWTYCVHCGKALRSPEPIQG